MTAFNLVQHMCRRRTTFLVIMMACDSCSVIVAFLQAVNVSRSSTKEDSPRGALNVLFLALTLVSSALTVMWSVFEERVHNPLTSTVRVVRKSVTGWGDRQVALTLDVHEPVCPSTSQCSL